LAADRLCDKPLGKPKQLLAGGGLP
jgi:hypothetical protein